MPELTTADVESFTGGRLVDGEDETQRILDEALLLARRYCGWHVTPELSEIIAIDGGGGHILTLPTMLIVELAAISEDGTVLDPVADVTLLSPRGKQVGMLCKNDGTCWTWSYGGVTIDYTHGFNKAPDFNAAALSYIARTSLSSATGSLQRTAVGPFSYAVPAMEECSAFTDAEQARLNLYKLEPAP